MGKLREAEELQGQGLSIPLVCKQLGVSEQTFHRWRLKYGALREDEAHRLEALESHYSDVVPEGLHERVPHDVTVFGVMAAPFGRLVLAERRAGWMRVGVSVHGIDVDRTWLGTTSNRLHRVLRGAVVDGEVAGQPLHVRRESSGLPWKSRKVHVTCGGRSYVLVRRGRMVTLLDDRNDVVATADERHRKLALDRSGDERLLVVLCLAANLDAMTRSPLAAVFQ